MSRIKGIHHVSMKCTGGEELSRVRHFYVEVLGLTIAHQWPGGLLLDTGNGLLEILVGEDGTRQRGALRHVALCTGDVDACARAAAQAGYEVFLPPQNKSFPTDPPYTMRIAFCTGPLGEEVEFFCPLD